MSDDTSQNGNAQSPTIEVTSSYTSRRNTVEETLVLDAHEVEDFLEMALRGSLDGVDARTISRELKARSHE